MPPRIVWGSSCYVVPGPDGTMLVGATVEDAGFDEQRPGGLAGARVTSLVLCEHFEDQVNLVRAEYAARTETLLFTRGETSKALP